MDLSLLVVVLHYRGIADTRECLASLGRQSYDKLHVLVIDNGSAEPLDEAFAAEFPWAEVLRLPENNGWAGGNNVGIRLGLTRGDDMVCLLNNDTVLPDHAVHRLMATAARLDRFILHPAIDSMGADEPAQLDPLVPAPLGLQAHSVPDQPGVFEILAINGACLIAPLDLFREIGLIDERFFLLCEDADIGQRAAAAGYRTFCDTLVHIRHKESLSFGGRRSPIKTYYGIRNILLFQRKHLTGLRLPLTMLRRFLWTVWATAEAVGQPPRSWWRLVLWTLSDDRFARAVRMGARDYLRGRFGRLDRHDEARLAPK